MKIDQMKLQASPNKRLGYELLTPSRLIFRNVRTFSASCCKMCERQTIEIYPLSIVRKHLKIYLATGSETTTLLTYI